MHIMKLITRVLIGWSRSVPQCFNTIAVSSRSHAWCTPELHPRRSSVICSVLRWQRPAVCVRLVLADLPFSLPIFYFFYFFLLRMERLLTGRRDNAIKKGFNHFGCRACREERIFHFTTVGLDSLQILVWRLVNLLHRQSLTVRSCTWMF